MDIFKMLNSQDKLDKIILQNAEIKEYPDKEIRVALLTELGELANEVQSFKYWKHNKNIDRQKILEEFADCLHFALSLQNHFKYLEKCDLEYLNKSIEGKTVEDIEEYYKHVTNFNINAKFLIVYKSVALESKYILKKIIKLGLDLRISPDEMEEQYYKKYEKNIERQKEGY